jgi:hypothetical protein
MSKLHAQCTSVIPAKAGIQGPPVRSLPLAIKPRDAASAARHIAG